MVKLGSTEAHQGRVKEDGVKPCVVVPDGEVRCSGTNHSLGCSLVLGMSLQEQGILHPSGRQGSAGCSCGHPIPCQ